jgi:putative peptidoglycan lipid II flippase
MTIEPTAEQREINRNVILVAAAFVLAAATGLVRNMVVARQFGIGADLDAYYAGFKLPDLLFTVVAGGALATAFIPMLLDFLTVRDRRGAWRFTAAVTNWAVLVVGALAAVAAALSPWLVRIVIAPGFAPDMQAETASVMRLVLLSTVIFAISSVLGSALQGFKSFLWPALGPVVYPLGVIIGALWLAPAWGVRGLAAGAVLGSLLHLGVKIPGLLRHDFRWRPSLNAEEPIARDQAGETKPRRGPLGRLVLLMAPRVLDLGVFHLTLVVTTNLASRLGAGSVSALEWGWDAMQLPETIIGTAFGLVALPTLAEFGARGDLDGLRRTLAESLRTVQALAVPAAFALILLGRPLLQAFYQSGAFDAAATEAVYIPLSLYALGLPAHAAIELVARTFFARKDTVTPLLVAVAAAAANILLCIILMGPLGYGGLALANSLAVTGEALALLVILRRRLGGVEGRGIAESLGRVLLACLGMSASMIAVLAWGGQAGIPSFLLLIAAGGAGGITYLLLGRLLGVREITRFATSLGRRGRHDSTAETPSEQHS